MSRLALTFACCRYDRMDAIREGDVVPAGLTLNCITLKSGREIFDRMVGGQEFDVAELSASEFISLMGRGDCPFVALPVFPSRVFRHGYIFINTRRGIRTPKDLEGKRVGLPLYTQTAAIWARGHLMHEFNVDLATIRWVEGAVEKAGAHGRPHAPALLRAVQIEQNTSAEPLGTLLARGAIDAPTSSGATPMSPACFATTARLSANSTNAPGSFRSCISSPCAAISTSGSAGSRRASTMHSSSRSAAPAAECATPARSAPCCRG